MVHHPVGCFTMTRPSSASIQEGHAGSDRRSDQASKGETSSTSLGGTARSPEVDLHPASAELHSLQTQARTAQLS